MSGFLLLRELLFVVVKLCKLLFVVVKLRELLFAPFLVAPVVFVAMIPFLYSRAIADHIRETERYLMGINSISKQIEILF